eukprot:15465460-Alexandrium_andersonii.AAC.1
MPPKKYWGTPQMPDMELVRFEVVHRRVRAGSEQLAQLSVDRPPFLGCPHVGFPGGPREESGWP